MKLTPEQTRTLAAMVGLDIPEEDLENVTLRVTALLESMAEIEAALGEEMDVFEPVPPVFPREDF
jgi:hypothetical protein